MRLFEFTTGMEPGAGPLQGAGVVFPDGVTVSYVLWANPGTGWTAPIDGSIAQIEQQFSAYDGYVMSWLNVPAVTGITPYPVSGDGGDYEITGTSLADWGEVFVASVMNDDGGEEEIDWEVTRVADRRIYVKAPELAEGTWILKVRFADYKTLPLQIEVTAPAAKSRRAKK